MNKSEARCRTAVLRWKKNVFDRSKKLGITWENNQIPLAFGFFMGMGLSLDETKKSILQLSEMGWLV